MIVPNRKPVKRLLLLRPRRAMNSSRPETVYTLPPTRPPETEEEIALAMEWLKSQGYLRSTRPTPPPVPPPLPETVSNPSLPPLPPWQRVSVPPAARPARQPSRSGSGIWLLLAFPLGFFVLVGLQPKQFQFGTPPTVEVRRALPVVPRALPARAPELTALSAENAHWHAVRFADGSSMQIFDRGWLGSTSLLPGQGQFVGDAYVIGNHYWIWQQPANGPASWIDP